VAEPAGAGILDARGAGARRARPPGRGPRIRRQVGPVRDDPRRHPPDLRGRHLCQRGASRSRHDGLRGRHGLRRRAAGRRTQPPPARRLRLLGQGLLPREIAARLDLSVKTVGTYEARLKEKLGLRSTSDLLKHAIRTGRQEQGRDAVGVRSAAGRPSLSWCYAHKSRRFDFRSVPRCFCPYPLIARRRRFL